MQKLIYLSPHLDDAVFSCGAILWDQAHLEAKTVEVWTIFAGDAPTQSQSEFVQAIHARWQTPGNAPAMRRSEDDLACARLGCSTVHLEFQDCIYRSNPDTGHPRIRVNEDLFVFDPFRDLPTVDEVVHLLEARLPGDCLLVIPLGVGNHIDHQITRLAAERLSRPLAYYADYPYASDHPEQIAAKVPENLMASRYPLPEQSLHCWQAAVSAYASQVSTFWRSIEEMKQAIHSYSQSPIGNTLWVGGNLHAENSF
jgi:LmbE family N-acetylglucosaminyl deacetylase